MKKLKPLIGIVFLVLITISCKVTQVGRYDAVIDKTINDVQQQLSTFFVKAESEAGTPEFKYENYKPFYDALKVEMSTLRIRSAAINENAIADKEILLLDDNISKLEQLHKLGINSYEEVGVLKSGFEQQLSAILKLQMALKSHAKPTS